MELRIHRTIYREKGWQKHVFGDFITNVIEYKDGEEWKTLPIYEEIIERN